jgi:hypothetical protein
LLESIRVSIGSRNIINTNVTLKQIFEFLFKDHFEAVFNFNDAKDTTINREMFRKVISKDLDKENLEDGYSSDSTTDSKLSLYSYNKKHNIKDI